MCPTFSRRGLRQNLGLRFLRDVVIGTTTGSWGTTTGSANIVDSAQADPTASGEQLYQRHWLRLLGSVGFIQDLRVASFNTGSGAFFAAQTLATTIYSGMPFEVHALLSPSEKDRALDDAIRDVRYQEEVPIWAIDAGAVYTLPASVLDVIEAKYYSTPLGSLTRGEGALRWYDFESTGSGPELRISPSLSQSQQLIIDAILCPTLGAGDLATVNLPSEDWVLAGAAARCFWLLEARSPGQETGQYKEKRREMARLATGLAARFTPHYSRRIMLDRPY